MYCQAIPSLSNVVIIQKPIKYIGGAAELTCFVPNLMKLPLAWIKVDIDRLNEPVVISNRSILFINDSRFSLKEINHTNYTLQVYYLYLHINVYSLL